MFQDRRLRKLKFSRNLRNSLKQIKTVQNFIHKTKSVARFLKSNYYDLSEGQFTSKKITDIAIDYVKQIYGRNVEPYRNTILNRTEEMMRKKKEIFKVINLKIK